MCGIIGYIGNKQASPVILEGLRRLEYRGYDSCGMATVDGGKINVIKTEGKIKALDEKSNAGKLLRGNIGIGHTRWATHGKPNETNSHPHVSQNGKFVIVHNGIIENFAELREKLKSEGVSFKSETDSEVIAQLLEHTYDGDMIKTLKCAVDTLAGSYAVGILCVDTPDKLYAIRKDSPLIVGLGEGENLIVSDFSAALDYTHDFALLENRELCVISNSSAEFYDADGNRIEKEVVKIDWNAKEAQKGGFPHFMIKEIFEQPKAITDTVRPRIKNGVIDLDGIEFPREYLDGITGIDIVGCGSAYHAGIVGKYFIEKYCRLRVNCELASEYIYSDPIVDKKRLTIIISQSGETADTLAALRLAKSLGSRTLAIVNVVHSSIAREADDVLYTHAGPEIAVATTKGYTTQVAALYLVGLKIALTRETIEKKRYSELLSAVEKLPSLIELELRDEYIGMIKRLAGLYYKHHCVFFIGRGADYAASLEGALKLKEISYIHAEAYAAGELKHGTISLVERGTLTVAAVTQRDMYYKMENNVLAVSARDGTVLAVASPENVAIKKHADELLTIPECDDDVSPVLTAVALQIFAYYVAVNRGCNIDQPRNLAKSVTVE